MDGFIVINKEKGMTSHDVCNKIKKIFSTKHVGHTGTLDPNTTGVLVVAINKACKLMPLLLEHEKEYNTTVLFGKKSDTLDITGNILEDIKCEVITEAIDKAIEELKEAKTQIPPIYSSIKVNGKKLYEYARSNKEVKILPREINIYELKRTSDVYSKDGYNCVDLYMKVSKGFYVRSLCRDLGEKLNVPSLMLELDRASSGTFNKDISVKLDDPLITNKVLSIEDVFCNLESIKVNDYMAKLIYNGVVLDERQIKTDKPFKVYNNNKLIAIYEVYKTNCYKPVVIFKEE
ncbi:MAG: tRNA pseudouridine(55) synthase TruB [Anaeroplasmataceae bacterium]